jgi:predicted ATP-dependent serine protease
MEMQDMTQSNPPQPRANRDDILKAARTLFPEGSVVELRALDASTSQWRSGHTEYGYFDNHEALADAAVYLGECAPVVYFTLNEVDPRLLNRAANKLRSQVGSGSGGGKKPTTSDKDIQRYRYLLIDCDPKRPADIASSHSEHEAARERAQEVYMYLKERGWPNAVCADSGNGYHLLYRIDLENTTSNEALVKRVLAALAFHFSDAEVTIDESVYNPARICKLYGTMAANKGDDTVERPHLVSELRRAPKGLHTTPVTLEQLQAVAATLPEDVKPERKGAKASAAGPYDMDALIERHPDVLEVKREGQWKDNGYKWLLDCCPFDENHTDNSAVLTLVDGVPGFRCWHNSCSGKGIKALWELLGENAKPERSAQHEAQPEPEHATSVGSVTPTWFSAEALIAQKFAPVKWAVTGVLPEGASLLAGKPKMGKSWLGMGLAVNVASGAKAFGSADVERGNVLYLALEDNKRRLKERLQKMLAGRPVPKGLYFETECPRVNAGGLEHIEAWLQAHPDARLVIVDTLAKIRPLVHSSQGMYQADYLAVEGLKRLSDTYRVTLLIITHLRKGKSEDGDVTDEISGSTGLTGGVDGTLVLKRERGQADAVLHVTGRDVEEAELAMQFNQDTCTWTLAGPAEAFLRSRERTDIMRVLRNENRAMGPSEVAAALGKDSNTVGQRMWKMGQDGELRVPSRGLYALPSYTHNDDKENKVGNNDKDDKVDENLSGEDSTLSLDTPPIRFTNPGGNRARGTNLTNLTDRITITHRGKGCADCGANTPRAQLSIGLDRKLRCLKCLSVHERTVLLPELERRYPQHSQEPQNQYQSRVRYLAWQLGQGISLPEALSEPA